METANVNYLWNIWNVKETKIKNTSYTLKGFSIAALRTNFFIKELNIMLDAGLSSNYSPDHIFITHTHTDHCANLPYNLYAINDSKSEKMKIYVPDGCFEKTDCLIKSVHTLNEDEYNGNYEIVSVTPNFTIEIEIKGKKFIVEIIECDHTVKTVGYGFIETKKKLKTEYIGKSSKEIVELKKMGIDINYVEQNYNLLYLGDTSCKILENSKLEKYSTIMIECTFLEDEDIERANITKHMHWKQLEQYVKNHPDITFILYHFSSKYKRNFIDNYFSEKKISNVEIWNSN